jgi:hypothetical protein
VGASVSGFVKATVNVDELNKIIKKYKKIKKYMKSNYYALRVLDNSETIVTKLLKENDLDA